MEKTLILALTVLLVVAALCLASAVLTLRKARAELRRARNLAAWRRVPPDVRIATIALALEHALFAKSETPASVEGVTAEQLRIVLRWCQNPMQWVSRVESVE